MARITWDDITERLFETGVKNCVLYVRKPDGSYNYGVAWNGLTAVTQSPEGAEPTDIFADDIKYLVLRSPENFKASVEAYTYPEEFLPCEGTAIPIPGVYIDQQPYQTFSICYKTSIGNDTDGDDHGYKIHIIYNCLATPSEKDYGTIDEDPDAITFNWELDSIPMLVNGFKPTSALTIDSTKVNPGVLRIIEDTLYGFGVNTDISVKGSRSQYTLIESETGELDIAEHPTPQQILDRYTEVFEIEDGESYEVYSTGNRLIYGLYNEIVDGELPVDGVFVSDNDHASDIHTIRNDVNANYLVVYYQQGTMIGAYDAFVTKRGSVNGEPTLMMPDEIASIIAPVETNLLISEDGRYILIGGDRIIIR